MVGSAFYFFEKVFFWDTLMIMGIDLSLNIILLFLLSSSFPEVRIGKETEIGLIQVIIHSFIEHIYIRVSQKNTFSRK